MILSSLWFCCLVFTPRARPQLFRLRTAAELHYPSDDQNQDANKLHVGEYVLKPRGGPHTPAVDRGNDHCKGNEECEIMWLITRSINQPTNQPTNRSINQPINQSINESLNQSTIKPINQSTNQPTDQSTNQSIYQLTNQSINHSTNQPINQSVNHSTNKSISHPIDETLGFQRKVDQGDGTSWENAIAGVLGVSSSSERILRPNARHVTLINFWLTTECFTTHSHAVHLAPSMSQRSIDRSVDRSISVITPAFSHAPFTIHALTNQPIYW